tara:strand:+ start:802 stop:966 length:165 start_codon:yes stop_codon:yes gene_type:complete
LQRCEEFTLRFAKIRLAVDPIFVRDGDIWTSAGVRRGSIWRWPWWKRISVATWH